jgi:REP-associated tyrosine transposase
MAGTYTKLYYHIVFTTKNRIPFINETIDTELHKYIAGIIRNLEGSCIEINGTQDHVHILTTIPPKISISEALRSIKASSSKWLRESKPALSPFAWQDGYSAFTVSASQLESVRQYIRDQKSHHHTRDFKAELLALLEKHGIEYDERYLLDWCRRCAARNNSRFRSVGLHPRLSNCVATRLELDALAPHHDQLPPRLMLGQRLHHNLPMHLRIPRHIRLRPAQIRLAGLNEIPDPARPAVVPILARFAVHF